MSARTGRRATLLLSAIVLLGLVLRIWYAAEALRINRFVDEKYSLLNIRTIVSERTLQPASSYYPYPFFNVPPALLVAASDAHFQRTGDPRFEAIKEKGFGPAAFLLTRLVQTLYGALALYLIYLIGKRVFSRQVGLIGALALAFMPWHIHASGYFKPDAQLVAMILLAFYASLRALEKADVNSYLLAGVTIALAMSTKMTGGVIAVPLVVGTLASGWRDRRRLALLALAGITSAGLFVILNPYWRYYPVWLAGLERDYAMRAARQGMNRWQVPGRLVELITDPYTLGPWLGTVALLAIAVLVILCVRSAGQDPDQRVTLCMLVSFPIVYTVAYSWKTPFFKDNNFLPVVPFFVLALSWALIELWRRGEGLWSFLTRVPARVGGLLVLCLLLMPSGLTYAYRTTTPTTLDRALAFLGRNMRPAAGRLVLVERIEFGRPVWEGGRRFGRGRSRIESVQNWSEVPVQRMELADGLVRVREGQLPRLERLTGGEERVFEAQPFRVRGPAVVATVHRWSAARAAETLSTRRCGKKRGCFVADLPADVDESPWISLTVNLGFARGSSVDDVVAIRVGDRQVPLLLASKSERGAVLMTEKFEPPAEAGSVVFEVRRELSRRRQFAVELHRWIRSSD